MGWNTIRRLAAVALVLVACGDDEESSPARSAELERAVAEAQEAAARAQEEVREATDGDVDPCAILTPDVVAAVVDVPDGVELTGERGSVARNLCTYRWDNPDFDQEAYNRQVMERMRKAIRGRGTQGVADGIVDMAMDAKMSREVAYTHMPESDSAEQAAARFESGMRVLNDGVESEVDTPRGGRTKVGFQATTQEVEGVGDQAQWAPRMSQLSVQAGTRVFHLTVQVVDEPEKNLELAKQLAARLIDAG